jgi:nucleotide sugar dehydrogenase
MTDLVVVGLGYVGLPLAQAAVTGGLEVLGYDADAGVVQTLSAGRSHVDDLSDDDVRTMLDAGFAVSGDEEDLHGAAVIVICVPTPLANEGGPDLRAVITASEMVARHLQPGTLVVLESTTWPGTTEEVVRPILERSGLQVGRDIHVAFSPERIDPGNPTYGMRNTPKVVGGVTPQCGDAAEAFYSRFIDTVVRAAGTREAEMAKLLENTYRQVNIALVNEMAKFSHELGIDFWDVIRCASTKPFGFQPFTPGPGVGGHCIPIDPSYLSHRVQARLGYPFRFVELAQEVNRSMPRYVADRAWRLLNREGKAVQGRRVLLLGITYKPGIADQRESPAIPLAQLLAQLGADLAFYDPFIPRWELNGRCLDRVADLRAALRDADLVIHLQPHQDYDETVLADIETPVLDTRGRFRLDHVERL